MQIIPSWIFYAIHVIERLRHLSQVVGGLGMGIVVIFSVLGLGMIYGTYSTEKEVQTGKTLIKPCKSVGIIAAVLILISTFLPSKEVMYLMLANRFITYENVEFALDGVKESIDYIFEKIEGLK